MGLEDLYVSTLTAEADCDVGDRRPVKKKKKHGKNMAPDQSMNPLLVIESSHSNDSRYGNDII